MSPLKAPQESPESLRVSLIGQNKSSAQEHLIQSHQPPIQMRNNPQSLLAKTISGAAKARYTSYDKSNTID